ncbi:MAG: pyruvate formate lyase family protein [bacterium]
MPKDVALGCDVSQIRIEEALYAIRDKDVRSATIERLKITWEAYELVKDLPQQLQLGEGLYYILDHISVPVLSYDLILGRINEKIPDEEDEQLLIKTQEKWHRSIPPWMLDGGHECFDWKRLLKFGLPGLEEFARQELDRRISSGETGTHLDFLRGAERVYQAFRNYARRYAFSAQEIGLKWQANNCFTIAEHPPKTFAEALQLIWLVGIVYCSIGAVNATLTFGRLDELLLDFYLSDIDSGILTREEAGAIIEDFYCKNNLLLGRGEHQMSDGNDTGWLRNLCYDSPQYVILGGKSKYGPSMNELTQLFIEKVVPELENPVIVLRYSSDLPKYIWQIACDKMRNNASFMVYNDNKVIPAMVHCGIEHDDAITYTMHGCNWPDIPGKAMDVEGCHISLPRHIIKAIMEGDEPKSIDEVYERFSTSIRTKIKGSFEWFRQYKQKWDELAPGDLRIDDCFQDGPIAYARSWCLGGTKYSTIVGSIRFIGTAADCMSALDEVVFNSKKVSMSVLRKALADDFIGYETVRQLCINAPKFGQDDDRADKHAYRILDIVTKEFDRESRIGTEDQVIAFRCLTTDMGHIREGESLMATPDGRHSGKPFSDNTSPTHGSCKYGITAMFRSISKLPFNYFNSGALNVRIQRQLVSGENGLNRLSVLLRTFFEMGGLQVQLSIADTDELRDAQIHPEAHRDLMVRITGYSAVFIDMCRSAQDEIIRRQGMFE